MQGSATPPPDDELRPEKYAIVRELFVDTADDNYITGRWCYSQGLFVDFGWLAVHALEKYLKAVLLLNGRSSIGYGHDVTALYRDVMSIGRDLLPDSLDKPARFTEHWQEETPAAYLERLYSSGNADNRYLLFGYSLMREDLFKLDRMVFSVRRLCTVLDEPYLSASVRRDLGQSEPGMHDFTTREFLLRRSDYWQSVAGGKLAEAIAGKRGEYLQGVVLNYNLAFAPNDYEHPGMPLPWAAHNSILLRHIIEPLNSEAPPSVKDFARETRDWVVANIQLPRETKRELLAAD